MTKKTAVEWLYTQLQMNNEILVKGTLAHQDVEEKIFKHALEKEKQQICNAWENGYDELDRSGRISLNYYNETFKSEEK